MRKMIALVVSLSVFFAAGFLLTGCSQTTPDVKSSGSLSLTGTLESTNNNTTTLVGTLETNINLNNTTIETVTQIQTQLQPKGLTVRGTVYDSTQNGGFSSTSPLGQPLENVTLYLSGAKVSRTTVSDSNGEYIFTDLPANFTDTNGYTIVAVKAGLQRTIVSGIRFGNDSSAMPDNSIITQDIQMSSRPVVLSIIPAPGTILTAAVTSTEVTTIEVNFNESMDINSVKPTFTAMGIRTYSLTDDPPTIWSNDNRTLKIIVGRMLPNQNYRLLLDFADTARDLSGNVLAKTAADIGSSGGIREEVYDPIAASQYYYRTSASVPGAPSFVNVTFFGGPPYIDDPVWAGLFNYQFGAPIAAINGAQPILFCFGPASGEVTGYNIYLSTNPNGPWFFERQTSVPENLIFPPAVPTTIQGVNMLLFGAFNVDTVPGSGQWLTGKRLAFCTDPVYVKVTAYNGQGEGPGLISGAIKDNLQPNAILGSGSWLPPIAPNGLPNYAVAGPNQYKGCYLAYNEPPDLVKATNPANYSSSTAGVNVTSASLAYYIPGQWVMHLTFNNAAASPSTITISNVTDLAGNSLAPGFVVVNLP